MHRFQTTHDAAHCDKLLAQDKLELQNAFVNNKTPAQAFTLT
jgi:hypothetical protein